MMKQNLFDLRILLFISLVLGACSDLPTSQEHFSPRGVTASAAITLEPVIVVAPPCDPYTSLSGCNDGGGDCMTSTSEPGDALAPAGCGSPGGGSSGGSGGSTSGGGGSGSSGSGSPPSPNDYNPDMTPPDCTKPVLMDWEHAYCNSQIPSGERLTRTVSALQRIAERGGECANIAAVGQAMLASGKIRYFQHEESIHGSYIGWGNPDIGALLAGVWVDDFGGTAAGVPNFDNKLIHELEHAMGRGHFPDGTSNQTPNSLVCAGLA